MEIEKNFWETKEGKIIGHGIHDHNSAIELLRGYLEYSECPNNIFTTKEEYNDKIKKLFKKTQVSIDYIYTSFKNIHEENLKEINKEKD